MGIKLRHKEKEVAKAIKGMLTLMEAAGQIVHHDRLNSGTTFSKDARTGKSYAYNMCRPGTPDLYVILNDGTILWIEAKSSIGKQSDHQVAFEHKVMCLPGHHYIIARGVSDVIDFIDKFKLYAKGRG